MSSIPFGKKSHLFPSNKPPTTITKSATPFALSFLPPTRPSSHPLILINPFHSTRTGTVDDGPLSPPAQDIETLLKKIEPFVHARSIDGIFLRADDVQDLALGTKGEAETCYGMVQRFSSVVAIIFGREAVIDNVYELPAAFENTVYAEGVIGFDTFRTLGLSVAIDHCGMVYLRDPELSEYSI